MLFIFSFAKAFLILETKTASYLASINNILTITTNAKDALDFKILIPPNSTELKIQNAKSNEVIDFSNSKKIQLKENSNSLFQNLKIILNKEGSFYFVKDDKKVAFDPKTKTFYLNFIDDSEGSGHGFIFVDHKDFFNYYDNFSNLPVHKINWLYFDEDKIDNQFKRDLFRSVR